MQIYDIIHPITNAYAYDEVIIKDKNDENKIKEKENEC